MSTDILVLACLARGPVTLDGIAEALGKSYDTAWRGVVALRKAGFRVQERASAGPQPQRAPVAYWVDGSDLLKALRALAK